MSGANASPTRSASAIARSLKEGRSHQKMKRALALLIACLFAQSSFAAEKWTSVRSKNFQVVGNATDSEIRRVARHLEQFRTTLGAIVPRLDQVFAPTTVVVLKNEELFKSLIQPADDVNYLVVIKTAAQPVLLHEYAHLLMRSANGYLPLWVREGLAEYYGTFEPGGKETEFSVGRAYASHVSVLNGNPLMSLDDFCDLEQSSSYYNEKTKQGLLYAESWALAHYLLGSEKRRPQFVQFLSVLVGDKSADEAFNVAFQTDYGTIEKELRDYLRNRSNWPVAKITSKDDRGVTVSQLSEAQTEYYIGDLLLHTNRLPEAETHLKSAIEMDAKLHAAHSSLGALYGRDKKYDDAIAHLKPAVDADPRNALINFYYASLLQRMDDDGVAVPAVGSGSRYEDIRKHLKAAIDAAPQFIEPYVMLAGANLLAAEHLDENELILQKAISAAPGRHDLPMLLAQTLLRQNKPALARSLITTIARNANDPDARKRATGLLDQLDSRRSTFAEIKTDAAASSGPHPQQPRSTSSRRDTVIEAVTPIAPSVEGEKVTGLLTLLDCNNGLTLRVRTDKATLDFHTTTPEKIQFLSYTADVTDNIKCGPRNPGTPVAVTYRPNPNGPGEPLVVEFLEKK